ncbi:ArpU family phage packaging/lysis transcriptional regulator [Candidatus Enterococcus clewellii]|uniref:Uncharacterized protein n=1 Tax=Candidatus Enterococcus clewellii TaxID=1834193 RepID=A0A242K8Q0_9ENTE|nr:ArpU family phage packaging/lysis transcriptional regulator [Enterococcus sp. 9E7_DIV0242]OTP17158.1 hypothetical protein A5888_001296 [Enterococcus sp. 9E7_DIV0242]
MLIFFEIDQKKTKRNVKKLLGMYPHFFRRAQTSLKLKVTSNYYITFETASGQELSATFPECTDAELELQKIVKGIDKLDLFERQLVYDKFIDRKKTNVALCMNYHISESTFYRKMDKALLHFAESYDCGRLLAIKYKGYQQNLESYL